MYANTHTEASATGRRTTALREQARAVIHRAVNGGADDVVIFCGSGATGAIDKLIRLLELERGQRPVVFIGPYEHHSNELPWRESVADVVTIREDADGRVDLEHLEHELRRHADRALKIGSFSAASNVTGIVTDVDQVAIALHRHGALVVLGLRRRRPVPADRHERGAGHPERAARLQGRGLPLAAQVRRRARARRACSWPSAALLRNRVPSVPGGGTILFVSPTGHSYHPDPAIREEGGTPAIVESIRAGLAFALKEAVGSDEIRRREHDFARRALARGAPTRRSRSSATPTSSAWRSSRSACATRAGLLHANFVVAVLSDLFGIQARSGCFCAGPVHPPPVPDRRRVVAAHGRRGGQGPPGRQARVHPAELQLLHQRDRVRATSSTPST